MDGDSTTTDTSQLGITSEYMTGGHYVLQAQDGKKNTISTYTYEKKIWLIHGLNVQLVRVLIREFFTVVVNWARGHNVYNTEIAIIVTR